MGCSSLSCLCFLPQTVLVEGEEQARSSSSSQTSVLVLRWATGQEIFLFFYPALRIFSSLEKIWFEKTPPTLFSFLWNLHVLSFIFNFKYCFYPVVPIKSDPYICKSCRLMAQTGSGWWFSFPVRTEIIPQFVCLKTAPRPPRQQLPRSRSMTTSMMFTGLCRAYFLLLTLSYIVSTLPCCMSHY